MSGIDQRIIAGTLTCLRRGGMQGTSISAISRETGVARTTIYSHFGDIEGLVRDAIDIACYELVSRLAERTKNAETPAAAIVEMIIGIHREFRADPAAMMALDLTLEPRFAEARHISDVMLRIGGEFMHPVLRRCSVAESEMQQHTETACRWLLSILAYESSHTQTEQALRQYLFQTLVPALGPDVRAYPRQT